MKKCPKCNTFTEETDTICDICGFIFNNIVSEQSHNNLNIVYLNNNVSSIPRCPICKSSEIHKISISNKIGSVATFGILATGHISKTYKCDNCGMKF